MSDYLKRIGGVLGYKPKAIEAPKNDASKEVKAVDVSAKKVDKAATATIEKANVSSKASKAISKVKAFSNKTIEAISARANKISKAVKEFFSKNSKKIESKFENRQAQLKARKEQIEFKANLKKLSDKVFSSVVRYDNKAFKNTNVNADQKQKYFANVDKLLSALKDSKISKKEFDEIILNSEKRANKKIFADSRYGDAFKRINKEISYKEFYDILLNKVTNPVEKAYAKEINALAVKFADLYKKVKDLKDADKLNNDKSAAIAKLADNKEYKNFIGKDKNGIANDLKKAIVSKLGGEKAVKNLINNIKLLINSPYDFDSGVSTQRTQKQNDLVKEMKDKNSQIASLNKRLKELDAQEKAFEKEKNSIRSEVREPTAEKVEQRRQEVATIFAEYDAERAKIQADKEKILSEIKSLEESKPLILEQYRKEHLSRLNVQIANLADLIDLKHENITTLPREKTKMDTIKRYGKNTALYGVLPAAALATAGVGYYYLDPNGALAALNSANIYATATGAFVASKAVEAKKYVASLELAQKILRK